MKRFLLAFAALGFLSAPVDAAGRAVAKHATGAGRPVSGDAGDNPFLNAIFGRMDGKSEYFACFSRQYDDAHLAAHANQRVTFVKALVAAYRQKFAGSDAYAPYAYQVSLAFRFRDRPETLTSVAECGDGAQKDSLRGGAHCAGPGDAGSHLSTDGRRGIVLVIPAGADLWAPGPIDQRHDTVKNPFGSDDKTFRLRRTDVKQCEDLAFDRQKPLRRREP